jgi:hypothetical protein
MARSHRSEDQFDRRLRFLDPCTFAQVRWAVQNVKEPRLEPLPGRPAARSSAPFRVSSPCEGRGTLATRGETASAGARFLRAILFAPTTPCPAGSCVSGTSDWFRRRSENPAVDSGGLWNRSLAVFPGGVNRSCESTRGRPSGGQRWLAAQADTRSTTRSSSAGVSPGKIGSARLSAAAFSDTGNEPGPCPNPLKQSCWCSGTG